MTGELSHYRQGAREQVWADLLALGDLGAQPPARRLEIESVVRETMTRVRQNVDRLRIALPALGYVFDDPGRVRVAPAVDVTRRIAEVQDAVGGPLPLALRVFYEEVGTIDLRGRHPDWPFGYADPLVLDAPLEYVLAWLAEWVEDADARPFTLDIGPDFLRKAHPDRGGHYFMALPNSAVDGLLLGESTRRRSSTTCVVASPSPACPVTHAPPRPPGRALPGPSRGRSHGWQTACSPCRFARMLRIAMRIEEEALEDVLDVLLPLVPSGVQEASMANGVIELAVYGLDGLLPHPDTLRDIAGEALVGEVEAREVPFDWRERRALFGRGYLVGGRLSIRSPLDPPPVDDGLIDLVIARESTSFGTGAHPTTRASLELLLRLTPGGPFADLGCGTGALGIAAAKLGWAPVFAVDYTDDSVTSTRENAERNGVDLATFKMDLTTEEAPPAATLAANVPAVVHRRLAAELSPEVRHLIVSGIIEDDSHILLDMYAERGMKQVDEADGEGWKTVLLERTA